MRIVSLLALFLAAHSLAKGPRTPPAGPGSCYYAANCLGSTKAVYVSGNYCDQIGGKSWKPNTGNACYNF